MFQLVKKKLKDQRGLTLIELLAVIVILAIIAAIAIPSILTIIDNSKKDAHLANAQQLVAATRTAVAQNDTTTVTWDSTGATGTATLKALVSGGYIDSIKNPDGGSYSDTATEVTVTKSASSPTTYTYTVTLSDGSKTIYSGDPSTATRANVTR